VDFVYYRKDEILPIKERDNRLIHMENELVLQGQLTAQVQIAKTDKHALNTLLHAFY
jgi:hypothetical protein